MMLSLRQYSKKGGYRLRQLLFDPRLHLCVRAAMYVLAGFVLSAAAIDNTPLPLAMGLTCACTGWAAVLSAAGGIAGHLLLWGSSGWVGAAWLAVGLCLALFLSDRRISVQAPALLPALASLAVSAIGVCFQFWLADTTAIGNYLVQVALGGGSTWLFRRAMHTRNPICDWLCCAFLVLALAQFAPVKGLSLGIAAAAATAVVGSFPATVLAGLALDLSGICPVPMTPVLAGGYLVRFLPRYPRWLSAVAPALVYLPVMQLWGSMSVTPMVALALGGIAGYFLPQPTRLANRRGETGVAQVRLEMVASVLAQTEQLLLEVPPTPVDEDALVTRAAEQACGSCPLRRNCKDSRKLTQLPAAVLHKPLLSTQELPVICRKSGRFLAQLHRSQEQLRSIRADRLRQQEYRDAVVQQYRFLSEYLQSLSDGLARRADTATPCFRPLVHIYANRPAPDNGDRCSMFAGTGCRYYVLLCDGMGTGLGAVQEAKAAAALLRRLLTAGYPACHALQSLNSLCALRNRAGAVSVELLELQLDTGRGTLYKWGAAPSYLVSDYSAKKIGTAGPPPGLSVTDGRESAYPLSLRAGELLLLVSDGIGQEQALRCCLEKAGDAPGELARCLLDRGQLEGEDDATVVTVYLQYQGQGPSQP